MKVQGNVTRTQTIEGSILPNDLLTLIRSTFHIPEGATVKFHTLDTGTRTGLLQHAQMGWHPSPVVEITESNPVRFRIDWSLPVGKDEQG